MYTPLPDKVIVKAHKELLELHKRVVLNYLTQYYGMKVKYRKKFFILYEMYISEDNIRFYFNRPIKMFVYALVTGTLDKIKDYFPKI